MRFAQYLFEKRSAKMWKDKTIVGELSLKKERA